MKNLTLDEVIKKLQEAKELYGDIPITIDIKDTEDYITCTFGKTEYNVKDVIADKDCVTIYNY